MLAGTVTEVVRRSHQSELLLCLDTMADSLSGFDGQSMFPWVCEASSLSQDSCPASPPYSLLAAMLSQGDADCTPDMWIPYDCKDIP